MISKFIRENKDGFLEKTRNDGNYEKGVVMNYLYPILLRAQNSQSKTGYGWEWSWNCLVSEGTLYGETTGYPIVGCVIDKDYSISIYITILAICHSTIKNIRKK